MAASTPPKTYNMGHGVATITHRMRSVKTTAAFLLPHLKPTDRLLDLGCGPGTITVGFTEYLTEGSVLGVDYSPDAIELAKKTFADLSADSEGNEAVRRGTIDFEVGNVLEGLRYEDDSFDVVYLSQVLVHLPPGNGDLNTALREIYRVLKPNGVLASSDLAAQTYYPYTLEIHRLWTEVLPKATSSTPELNGVTIRKHLREAGFSPEKTQIGGSTSMHTGKERCQQLCDSFAGRLAKGQAFRKAFLDCGQTEDQVDQAIEYILRWNESEDAYCGQLNTESLAWK